MEMDAFINILIVLLILSMCFVLVAAILRCITMLGDICVNGIDPDESDGLDLMNININNLPTNERY